MGARAACVALAPTLVWCAYCLPFYIGLSDAPDISDVLKRFTFTGLTIFITNFFISRNQRDWRGLPLPISLILFLAPFICGVLGGFMVLLGYPILGAASAVCTARFLDGPLKPNQGPLDNSN